MTQRALLVAGGSLLGLSLVSWIGDRLWLTEIAASLRVQFLAVGVVVTLAALVTRAWVATLLAAAAVAVNLVVLAPFYAGVDAPATGAERLVVAHVNLQHRTVDERELSRALGERRPDLLFLLDPPRGWLAGRHELVGYRLLGDGSPKVGAVVLARDEIDVGRPSVEGLPGSAIVAETRLGGAPLWVLALHAQAPMTPRLLEKRNRSLRAAGRLAAHRGGARIVLGDFNTVPWSDAIERLEKAGGLESSAEGWGIQASWPALLGPAGIAIDQLLHSPDLVVLDREPGPTFGSTHRSLWVTLARERGDG